MEKAVGDPESRQPRDADPRADGASGASPAARPQGARERSIVKGFVAGVPFFATLTGILLTLVNVLFILRPEWKPEVTQVREVTVTDLKVAERGRVGEDGVRGNTIFYDISAIGYDADDITVAWLALDAETLLRSAERPTGASTVKFDTGTDRIAGQINVPIPADPVGCIVVRVFALPVNSFESDGEPVPEGQWLLYDVADTPAFDPLDPTNPRCPTVATMATPPAAPAAEAAR